MSRPPPPLGLAPAPVPKGFPGRVTFVKSARGLKDSPHHDVPEIAVCGRSNVGKSSLLNTLANRRQLARVSGTPGRTRLINFFDVQDRLVLVDLPGYGWAKVPKAMQAEWGSTIQGFLADRPQLVLCLLLVDIRREPGDDERNLLAWFSDNERPCLIVATKADKLSSARRGNAVRAIARSLGVANRDVVPFSSADRLGRDVLWGAILAQVAASRGEDPHRGPTEA